MTDEARKWLKQAEPEIKNMLRTFLSFPCRGYVQDALAHLRRLLKQNERMSDTLNTIVGYTHQEKDQTELWVHRTAKRGLDNDQN